MLTMKQKEKSVNHCNKKILRKQSLRTTTLKDTCEKHQFCNVADYLTAALLKKELIFRHFSGIFLIDSVVKITEQLF